MKFTDQQKQRMKEVFQELENQTETAKILSKEFGFEVKRQNISYWLKQPDEDVPLSEDVEKISEASMEQCVKILRKFAEANPDKVITRNFFRVNSPLAESAWNKHFGTFEEFKKQAGIKLTRHARKMELDIARHASIDNYRAMNDQKMDWGESYKKQTGERYQTVMVCSDVHDIECDPYWRFLWLETLARVQPETIVLNGDIFDLPEFGSYGVDPREWDVVGRIQWVHKFLGDMREICPDAEMIFIEGNHEYRLLRHLAEATPAMKAVLSDLHGFTVPKLLGLDAFEVNYVAPADLAVFTQSDMKAQIRRNWKIIHECLLAHHFPQGRTLGLPGWNGHHHKHLVYSDYSAIHGSYEWHQLGAGHKREASYCNGEAWSTGFLIVHVDTEMKRSQFEYIDTTNDHVVIGGKWYERKD
jgi:hypothetical protein